MNYSNHNPTSHLSKQRGLIILTNYLFPPLPADLPRPLGLPPLPLKDPPLRLVAVFLWALLLGISFLTSTTRHGSADFIFLGREMLRNPYFALLEADKLEQEYEWPKQYKRGRS